MGVGALSVKLGTSTVALQVLDTPGALPELLRRLGGTVLFVGDSVTAQHECDFRCRLAPWAAPPRIIRPHRSPLRHQRLSP